MINDEKILNIAEGGFDGRFNVSKVNFDQACIGIFLSVESNKEI